MDALKRIMTEDYYVHRVEILVVTGIVAFLLYVAFSLNLFKKG